MQSFTYDKSKIKDHENGFTLIEILVGLAIMSFIFVGIYDAYDAQMRSYNTQNQIVDMQQNIRAAMILMQKELRMAGANPDGTLNNVGFTPNSDAGVITMTPTQFAITYFSSSVDAANTESRLNVQCAYRLNNNQIQRYFLSSDSWQTVADNIDMIDFRYMDDQNNAIDDNADSTFIVANNFERIHSVQITIIARTSTQVSALSYRGATDTTVYTNRNGDTILDMGSQSAASQTLRRMKLSSEIFFRNIAYQ